MIRAGDTVEVVLYTPGLRRGERLIAIGPERSHGIGPPMVLVQRNSESLPLGEFWAFRFNRIAPDRAPFAGK